jgi:hypothetical protein
VVLHNPYLAPAIFSLASRVLLDLSLSFPYSDPARLSHDLAFHGRLLRGLQVASLDLGADAQNTMGRHLSLIIRELSEPLDDPVSYVRCVAIKFCLSLSLKGIPSTSILRELDRLLHPRVPPLVRSLPHVESLSLFRTEESVEEQGIRESFRIGVIDPPDAVENKGAENQPSVLAPAASVSPPRPYPNALADVGSPKAPSPLPTNRVSSSPPQISSQDNRISEPDNTPRPVPACEIPPSFMTGNLNASESRLGVAPEVTNPAEEDEEMPSIDMGSDSD